MTQTNDQTDNRKAIALRFVQFVDRQRGKIGWGGFTEPMNYDELEQRTLTELAKNAGFRMGALRIPTGDSCLTPGLVKEHGITHLCPFEFAPAQGMESDNQHVLASLLLSMALSTIIARLPSQSHEALAGDIADTMASLAEAAS